jgi:hypothetical protein
MLGIVETVVMQQAAPVASAAHAARLEPLVCASCGAPQPVGEADTVRCSRCGATAPLPPPYRMLRDASRISANDAAQLETLAADISRPTPAFKRVAIVLGYGIGILTLIIFGIGALIGAVLGVIGAAKVDAGEKVGLAIIVMASVACGLMSIPFVGEWIVGFATLQTTDAALDLATGGDVQWPIDASVGGILYVMSVVPIAIAWRTSESVSSVKDLQAKLAAAPPQTPGGACGCRTCGAALDVRPGALAARCIYCGTENLVAVPEAFAAKKKEDAGAINKQVREAVAKHDENRRSDRAAMWTMIALGPLLVPLLCGAGWLLHKLVAS